MRSGVQLENSREQLELTFLKQNISRMDWAASPFLGLRFWGNQVQ